MAAHPEAVPRPSNEARIKAALWFAGQGFGVFSVWSAHPDGTCRCSKGERCTSPGKHPIAEHGFKEATQDPKQIRTLLSAPSQPNYGLVCPEGVFAWDVDGEGWEDELAALEAAHGPLPPTFRTATRNGQHIILRWPEGHPRPMKHMFGWITRWGSGGSHLGYVVGPRSVHPSGFEYVPVGAFELGTLPDAWAEAAMAGSPLPAGQIVVGGEVDPATVGVGGRHDYLRDRARFYAGSIRDPQALFGAVWALNEKLPVPKSREEVERAIGDALTKYPADPVEEDPETGEVRVVRHQDGSIILPPADGEEFPEGPDAVAYRGLIGECVTALSPGTDASDVAMLTACIAFMGALVPASAYFNRVQTTSPFLAIVGESTFGRKGTAMYRVNDALASAVGADKINRLKLDGVASGEALISSMHDRQESDFDRTALLFEEEYATHLAAGGRDGSTLDPRMRQAFDGAQMHHRRVSGTVSVKEPYWLSALIAITPNELRAKLPGGALLNGSGNRWLWVPVRRRDVRVASVEPELPADLTAWVREIRRRAAEHPERLVVADEVGVTLSDYSEHLRAQSVGLAADMTRRYPVIAFRVALIHAAVEGSPVVGADHLSRALALTEYARAGIGWVFGQSLGNKDATLLLRHLQDQGTLTSSYISKNLIRDPIRRQDAIDELVRLGLAQSGHARTAGRPRTELHWVQGKGAYLPFFPLIGTPTDWKAGLVGQKGEKRTNGSAEGADKRAEVRKSPPETEQVSGSGRKANMDAIRRAVRGDDDAAGADA